jgi:uncharacterized FlaG/YvyC family protein
MALDLSSIQPISQNPHEAVLRLPGSSRPTDEDAAGTPALAVPSDLKSVARDLQRVSEAFNRRLSFSLNEKLGQVVVKVIDVDTDKVVREIPPTELQRVYERIREVIGLLIDKSA